MLDTTKIFQLQKVYHLIIIAKLLFKLNKFNEAINTMDEAIAQDPYNLDLLIFKVKLLVSMNNYEEAKIASLEVAKLD